MSTVTTIIGTFKTQSALALHSQKYDTGIIIRVQQKSGNPDFFI